MCLVCLYTRFITNFYYCIQTRGAVIFLVAVVTLLLFDHDEKLDHLTDHDCILFIFMSVQRSSTKE